MKDIVKSTLTGIILVFCVVFALIIQTNAAESDLDNSDNNDISQTIGNAGELQKDEIVTTTLSEKYGCEYYKIIIDEESKVIIKYKSNAGQSAFQLYDNQLSLIKEEKVKGGRYRKSVKYSEEITLKPGVYYIKVLTEDEESTGKYKRIYSISYSFNNYVKSITVTGNKTVSVNKTIRLKAIVKPDNATAKDIEWEVSNTGSAVIDTNTGILRAYKPGKVNVIAKATDGSGVKATFAVIIKPSKVSNLKIKRTGRKKIKVSWYNVYNASGYQLQYGRRKSTSRAKYRRISARKSTGTLSKIKNRKNYFVRVRAYYKSDNKNYYGDWSSYKKINIK